jgi:hypothetical protein
MIELDTFKEHFEVSGDVTDDEIKVMAEYANHTSITAKHLRILAYAIDRNPADVWPDRFREDGMWKRTREVLKWRTERQIRQRNLPRLPPGVPLLQQNRDNSD